MWISQSGFRLLWLFVTGHWLSASIDYNYEMKSHTFLVHKLCSFSISLISTFCPMVYGRIACDHSCGDWHWVMASAVELEVGSQWTTAGEEQAGPRNTPGSQPAEKSPGLPHNPCGAGAEAETRCNFHRCAADSEPSWKMGSPLTWEVEQSPLLLEQSAIGLGTMVWKDVVKVKD